MFNIKKIYILLPLCGIVAFAGDTDKRAFSQIHSTSGYTPPLQKKRHSSSVTTPEKHDYTLALPSVSPDHTPGHGTYFTNYTEHSSYNNITNILGVSRVRKKAYDPQDSSVVMAAPFFTTHHVVNDILENAKAGVKHTVIVGPSAVNSHAVKRLVGNSNIDLRVNDKIHTKIYLRTYTDADGVQHENTILGSANHTYCGYYHNHDQVTVLSDHYKDDFHRDVAYLTSHSIPYADYISGDRRQWSPYNPHTVSTTPQKAILNSRHHNIHEKMAGSIDKVPAGGAVIGSTFTLNDTHLVNSLKNAVQRGVMVKLYVDQKTKLPDWIKTAIGGSIYRVQTPSGIHHVKSLVCDKGDNTYTTYIGSNNFTKEAQNNDFNQTVVSTSPEDAQQYMNLFEQSLNRFSVVPCNYHNGSYERKQPITSTGFFAQGPARNLTSLFDDLDVRTDVE